MKIDIKIKIPNWAILLRTTREEKQIPQDVLAKKLGLSPMGLSHFEHGNRTPRIDVFEKWCEELGFCLEIIPKKKKK